MEGPKGGHQLPDAFPEPTLERQLELLNQTLEELQAVENPDEQTRKGIENTMARIAALRAANDGINN